MAAATLEVVDAIGRRLVRVERTPFTLGRRETNDLRLHGSEVSREHAEIVADGPRFVLRDRRSRYGTFVNGEAVTECVLGHGDRIRLGRAGGAEARQDRGGGARPPPRRRAMESGPGARRWRPGRAKRPATSGATGSDLRGLGG